MQAPAELNLICYQGANFDYTLTWNSGGTPVDLTNYDARMQVRTSAEGTAIYLNLTAGTGITLGGTAGTIYLEADAATTSGIGQGSYSYDLELISEAGYVTRLVNGTFLVDPEVTE